MKGNDKHKEKMTAFRLYAEGMRQKQIAQQVGVSEKTIGNWKTTYKWEEKLAGQKQTRIAEAYLLVSENIRQGVHIQTKSGQLAQEQADQLHQALTAIHQALTENHLI